MKRQSYKAAYHQDATISILRRLDTLTAETSKFFEAVQASRKEEDSKGFEAFTERFGHYFDYFKHGIRPKKGEAPQALEKFDHHGAAVEMAKLLHEQVAYIKAIAEMHLVGKRTQSVSSDAAVKEALASGKRPDRLILETTLKELTTTGAMLTDDQKLPMVFALKALSAFARAQHRYAEQQLVERGKLSHYAAAEKASPLAEIYNEVQDLADQAANQLTGQYRKNVEGWMTVRQLQNAAMKESRQGKSIFRW